MVEDEGVAGEFRAGAFSFRSDWSSLSQQLVKCVGGKVLSEHTWRSGCPHQEAQPFPEEWDVSCGGCVIALRFRPPLVLSADWVTCLARDGPWYLAAPKFLISTLKLQTDT